MSNYFIALGVEYQKQRKVVFSLISDVKQPRCMCCYV
jgi:hypothetical protein